ncbi:polypyrimidine tract-binding protein 2-like [Saccostrea echinata]|uniref:polypyrimidine tract-binding protein 2-like n=1 Tax=Saccostrea echinata TaxID=191078 RepID=UPI002A8075AA|nr:polypyrimidine tract-binding protein 2-like [Saccostrea echinata]
MVLCPGYQKNGRPCTNILEQKSKFCKLCGWKIDPDIFLKEAISCPNVPLNSEEKCGTWIERDQMFCDQCGWEVNHDFFPRKHSKDDKDMPGDSYSNLKTQMKNLTLKQEQPEACGTQRRYSPDYQTDRYVNHKEDPHSPSSSSQNGTSSSVSPRETRETKIGKVLFVHNLNEEKVTTEGLFNLFSIYGRVEIVKLFFKKKSSGLIQMDSPEHALLAIENLDRVTVWDCTMHVQFSKAGTIYLEDHSQFTKDFRNTKLFRGGPAFDYLKTACAPSPIIHLSNFVSTITKADINDVFSEYGNVLDIVMFESKGKRGALVEYASIAQSILAVMAMHNFLLPDNSRLNVTFSHFKSLNKK